MNVLLVPAHPGFPGQIPQSRKTVVCVCVSNKLRTGFALQHAVCALQHTVHSRLCLKSNDKHCAK